ncbi:MAG: helicase RepA family protein [Rhodospirillum sp.]|nr:helicase RepA family protein [Rhodospirillum sp.]MCF8492138.1 helicase RepA family protein [Rhodospirillum sp.]MCF8501055.1 helicase RepA family protein [Rhodospirillum sp.]
MVTVPLTLLDPRADTAPLVDRIQAWADRQGVPLRLVVIDTLARAMAGGNENASEDMGALVGNLDVIRDALGAVSGTSATFRASSIPPFPLWGPLRNDGRRDQPPVPSPGEPPGRRRGGQGSGP